MITVAIIGTAGRKLDIYKMNSEIYNKMIEKTKEIIEKIFRLDPIKIKLISGGAAWSDHIVIDLFLSNYISQSKLYLPCEWNSINNKYQETNTIYDIGKTANYYHKQFRYSLTLNNFNIIFYLN